MKIGIIDVGSNTVRLLAAERGAGGLVYPLHEARRQVGLGETIERRGRITDAKLAETARAARDYAKLARRLDCERLEVVVTAPGRQSANADDLLGVLHGAVGVTPRVLSAKSEGRFAYLGAVAAAGVLPGLIAVCDVGGGSTEVAFGGRWIEPDWVDSIDLGSLRLSSRFFADGTASRSSVRAARAEVRMHLEQMGDATPDVALAAGGSARALRKLVGRTLGRDELQAAIEMLIGRSPAKVARKHAIDLRRARTLLAGAVILAEVQARLGVPFEVARGGLREGLADQLLSELRAA
jgi:exopolyphosphatase / guanosine-5'-triphosphate,3'-diphosphate pyrophosphatase